MTPISCLATHTFLKSVKNRHYIDNTLVALLRCTALMAKRKRSSEDVLGDVSPKKVISDHSNQKPSI